MDDIIKTAQEKYNKAARDFAEARRKYQEEQSNAIESVIATAKYSVGDKVTIKPSWGNDLKTGIIRSVHGKERWGDTLEVCYKVGKITKSGEIHKIHNVEYGAISESKIIEVHNA